MPAAPTPQERRPPRWPALLAWVLWALALLALPVVFWLDHLLRQAGRPELVILGASSIPYVLSGLSAATIGAVLANRRPRHPVGWLLLALGLSVAVDGSPTATSPTGGGQARELAGSPPGRPCTPTTPRSSGGPCISFVLLLTPTGSLPSPRWRWWARVMAVAPAALLGSRALLPRPFYPPFQSVSSPFAVHVLVGPLDSRLGGLGSRHLSRAGRGNRLAGGPVSPRPRGRAPTASVGGVGGLVSVPALVTVLAGLVLGQRRHHQLGGRLLLAVLPLATGAAILRYRLYDLDRIISRTLAYGLLTVLLGLGLRRGRPRAVPAPCRKTPAWWWPPPPWPWPPSSSRPAAASSRPVDRRFNRRRHDAARTIEGFSARLRDQVDLDTLTTELLAVVDQTMQPTQASLWLRPPEPSRTPPGALASR